MLKKADRLVDSKYTPPVPADQNPTEAAYRS